jgi:hypothetical protein
LLLDHLLPMLLLLLPSSTCGMQALQRHPQRHRLQQPPSPHDAVLRAAYVEHTTELAAKTAAWALPPENCQENDPLVFTDADFDVAASVGNRHAGPDAASLYGGGMVYTTNAPILEPYECAYLIADADETMASGTAPGRFTYGGAVRDVRRLVMRASVPEAQLRATHHVVSASIPFSPLGAGARRGLPRLCARLAAAQAPLDLFPADRVAYANLGARTPECRSCGTLARTRCSHMSSGRAGAGYGLDQHRLAVSNALVVGYDAARNATRLPAHRDAALCTINVALSDEAEYEGGGTLIEASQQVGKRDHLLSHRPCRACR